MLITIREAIAADAEQVIAHVKRLALEPDRMILHAPGEFQVTVEQERALSTEYAASDNSTYLVAEVEGYVVGILSCQGSKRQANHHTASLGISVERERRGCGVGTALMETLVTWAHTTSVIQRLELSVFAHNAPAIRLYQKFGFVEEGRHHKAYWRDGHFIDSLTVARLL